MPEGGGMDVHGGLRVRLEYDKATRRIVATSSASPGVDVRAGVERAARDAERRAGYLRAWLEADLFASLLPRLPSRRQPDVPSADMTPPPSPEVGTEGALLNAEDGQVQAVYAAAVQLVRGSGPWDPDWAALKEAVGDKC